MSHIASLLYKVQMRLDGIIPSEYPIRELKLIQFDIAAILIAGNYTG
jgi:hypothetical protein